MKKLITLAMVIVLLAMTSIPVFATSYTLEGMTFEMADYMIEVESEEPDTIEWESADGNFMAFAYYVSSIFNSFDSDVLGSYTQSELEELADSVVSDLESDGVIAIDKNVEKIYKDGTTGIRIEAYLYYTEQNFTARMIDYIFADSENIYYLMFIDLIGIYISDADDIIDTVHFAESSTTEYTTINEPTYTGSSKNDDSRVAAYIGRAIGIGILSLIGGGVGNSVKKRKKKNGDGNNEQNGTNGSNPEGDQSYLKGYYSGKSGSVQSNPGEYYLNGTPFNDVDNVNSYDKNYMDSNIDK